MANETLSNSYRFVCGGISGTNEISRTVPFAGWLSEGCSKVAIRHHANLSQRYLKTVLSLVFLSFCITQVSNSLIHISVFYLTSFTLSA